MKGNCDADLVLQTVSDTYENNFDRAIIVSSDGDYSSLVKFLQERNKIASVISPSNNCSILMKRTSVKIVYLDWVKSKVNRK